MLPPSDSAVAPRALLTRDSEMSHIPPDFNIDGATEQAALLGADRIVLQYPMYWLSCPPLLKKWLDDVLTFGWAYGSTGTALHGKELLLYRGYCSTMRSAPSRAACSVATSMLKSGERAYM